jgi:hypothetical protein
MVGTSFAKSAKSKCDFKGDYSFYFWDPGAYIDGVGYFSVDCSGQVLPGGIINCNGFFTSPYLIDAGYESFIEGGSVFLERDGEGTMEIETNSSGGICGTGKNALELDISVVRGGNSVLFNSDGETKAGSGLIPQAGYDYALTGRADKCFAGQISGCYNIGLFEPFYYIAGNCTVCVNGAGGVTGGSCRCNFDGSEYLSEIETGGYTLGENCQSSTGYMWFTTSSDEICGVASSLALDFAVAEGGTELLGVCDPAEYVLDNTSLVNFGYSEGCAFEGNQQ